MKNVLQRFTHAAMLLFLAMSIAGCHGNNSDKKRVAVVISTLNNPWFVVLGEAAVKQCEELGYEATLFDSQNNPSKKPSISTISSPLAIRQSFSTQPTPMGRQ